MPTFRISSLFFVMLLLGTSVQAAASRPSQKSPEQEKEISELLEKPQIRKKKYLRKALGYGIVGLGVMFLGAALSGTGSVGIIILVGGSLLFFYGVWNLIRWIVKGGTKKKRKINWPDIFQKKNT